jgi:TPR repeat protein
MRQSTSNGASASGGASDPAVAGIPGGWSASEPAAAWRDAAAASGRWWIMMGTGFAALGCLALGAVGLRALWGPPAESCADGLSCNAAGVSYARVADANGADDGADLATAARFFQRGCELGHAPACNNLGLAYEGARGVPQDYARAMTAFERACSGGFAEGCSNQGTLYERGLGVPVNVGDAQRAYSQACRRGSALGCSNLGVLYAEGRGVAADDAAAARLFSEACRAGSQVGCANLLASESQAAASRPAEPVPPAP